VSSAAPPKRGPGSGYLACSRSPRYSVLFALPLLVGYEGLATANSDATGGLRNGADALFRAVFTAIAGARGPEIFMGAVILFGLGIVLRDIRANPGRLSLAVFAGMLVESAILACAFGIIVGILTAQFLGSLRTLAVGGQLSGLTWPTRLMLSLGAGLYEELFFRVLLVSGIAAIARKGFGLGHKWAGVTATLLGALIFSAFHYVGPFGDRLELQSFTFRAISGVVFSALYLVRGFGITAWAHAIYDGFLLLA